MAFGHARRESEADIPHSLKEALQILEEAAEDDKDALQELINQRYTHLKDVASEIRPRINRWFSGAKKYVDKMADAGEKKAEKMAQSAESAILDHPWRLLGVAGLLGITFGYLLIGKLLSRMR